MKQVKKMPRQQLEKFSAIFMQLGLVLVLFVVFISLEHQTESKDQASVIVEPIEKTVWDINKIPVYVKEEIKVKKQKVDKRRQEIINVVKLIDNNEKVSENSIIKKSDDDLQKMNIDNIITLDEDEDIEDIDDPTPIIIDQVTKIPVFKGCENLSDSESRKCLDEKIAKIVSRHFDACLLYTSDAADD